MTMIVLMIKLHFRLQRAYECDGRDVGLSWTVLVLIWVDGREDGADAANDTVEIAIREKTSAAADDGPDAIPE